MTEHDVLAHVMALADNQDPTVYARLAKKLSSPDYVNRLIVFLDALSFGSLRPAAHAEQDKQERDFKREEAKAYDRRAAMRLAKQDDTIILKQEDARLERQSRELEDTAEALATQLMAETMGQGALDELAQLEQAYPEPPDDESEDDTLLDEEVFHRPFAQPLRDYERRNGTKKSQPKKPARRETPSVLRDDERIIK